MYNWVETQFKSRGLHWLKGILYQTPGSQLCRNREGEQGQLIWGHPGSSVCPEKESTAITHILSPGAALKEQWDGPWAVPGCCPCQSCCWHCQELWCYQTMTEFGTGLPGLASICCFQTQSTEVTQGIRREKSEPCLSTGQSPSAHPDQVHPCPEPGAAPDPWDGATGHCPAVKQDQPALLNGRQLGNKVLLKYLKGAVFKPM